MSTVASSFELTVSFLASIEELRRAMQRAIHITAFLADFANSWN
jgi:hypothetical protein